MVRDHRKLRSFQESDALVRGVYGLRFPDEERYGLAAQVRRAAVSVAANIVEGSTRTSVNDYCRFLEIALGSARECGYLISLAASLAILDEKPAHDFAQRYDSLCASLTCLIAALRRC